MAVEKITDKTDRIAKIVAETEASKLNKATLFRGKMEELRSVRLEIDFPIYRMKNGRTQVEQYKYLEETGHSKDFFERGEENISAQQAQHMILLKLSKDSKGPIYQELEMIATQREPLMVTSDGVVLNGNRRLAAMRDLFDRNSRAYPGFSHVDAVILPKEANERDLELLEAELQMAPETKLQYGWIERRLKLRRHVEELKIPRDQIKETYRFKREGEINIELQQLKLAEEYLEKHLKKPFAYGELGQSEQIFKDLEKELRGKSGATAEIRRLVGYVLVKESRNLGSRVYNWKSIFGSDFEEILNRYAEEEGVGLKKPVSEKPTVAVTDDDDPLDGLSDVEQSPYEPLRHIFEDQEKTKDTAKKLARVSESLNEEGKEEKTRQAALISIQKVHQTLCNIDLTGADPDTYERIKAQINSIVSVSNSLKDQLDKISTGNTEIV